MKKPGGIIARFDPTAYWYNAREEILFGSGTFTLGCANQHQANKVESKWVDFLLMHEQGQAFTLRREGTSIHITLSPTGIEACSRTGYTQEQIEIFAMNTEWKKGFLADFTAHLKDLSL